MTRNLFIVNTPLQLLNATEARDRMHADQDNRLAVVRTPVKSGVCPVKFRQMMSNLIDQNWTDVWYPKINKIQQLAFAIFSDPFVRETGCVDNVYTGAFNSPQCHLINSIKHENLVVFDDGRGIHMLLDDFVNRPGQQTWRHRISLRKGAWPTAEELRVFSSFEINWPKTHFIQNDYRCLRERMRTSTPVHEDEIVIISQPIERFLGVKIDYEQMIENLHSVLSFKTARLINHPNDPNPPAMGESLACPIELFALHENYLPGTFVSFLSSATRTLCLIYDRPVVSLEILQSSVTIPLDYQLTDTYDEFRSSGVKVIPNALWTGVSARAAA